MTTHVNRLVSSSFYQLRRIKAIRRSLPTTTAITLVNSFVISRIDYCSSLLSGLPSYQLARVQSVLNATARIIYSSKRSDHVTPPLRDRLHWLRVLELIRFKLCLVVFKALNNLAPEYIKSCCIPVSNVARRAGLRSSSRRLLDIPRTRYPSTSELLHLWSLLNGCSRHTCLKYRFSHSLHDITLLAF